MGQDLCLKTLLSKDLLYYEALCAENVNHVSELI